MWWLGGYFHLRNPKSDTKQRIIDTIIAVSTDIAEGTLQAAYVHTRYEVPILFTHAGVRPAYYEHMRKKLHPTDSTELSAHEVAASANAELKQYAEKCNGYYPCSEPKSHFFEAGPDRGGAGIGGPL